MSFASILSTIEAHIAEYEAAIANSINNHNGLLGGLSALQRTYGIVSPMLKSMLPKADPMADDNDAGQADADDLNPQAPALAPVVPGAPAVPAEPAAPVASVDAAALAAAKALAANAAPAAAPAQP